MTNLSDEMKKELYDKKFEAYQSIVTHQNYIANIERDLLCVDIVSICTPIAFMSIQLSVVKNPYISDILSAYINPLLSCSLIIAVLFVTFKNLRNRLLQHQEYLTENNIVIKEINELFYSPDATDKDALRIIDNTTRLDYKEQQLVLKVKIPRSKQNEYYREALKTMGDVHIVCPKCNMSPWEFRYSFFSGKCQMCGNALRGKDYDNTQKRKS